MIQLTPKEIEICDMLVGSASNEQIALALGIKVGTVKTHCRSVQLKFGTSSRTGSAMKFMELFRMTGEKHLEKYQRFPDKIQHDDQIYTELDLLRMDVDKCKEIMEKGYCIFE